MSWGGGGAALALRAHLWSGNSSGDSKRNIGCPCHTGDPEESSVEMVAVSMLHVNCRHSANVSEYRRSDSASIL